MATTPSKRALIALVEAGGALDRTALGEKSGVSGRARSEMLRYLREFGFVERPGQEITITDRGRENAARGDDRYGIPRACQHLRQRCWNTLRARHRVTMDELIEFCEPEPLTPDIRGYMRRIMRQFVKGGYASAIKRNHRGHATRWQLERDTGPKAPVASRDGACLVDANTGDAFDISEPKEAGHDAT